MDWQIYSLIISSNAKQKAHLLSTDDLNIIMTPFHSIQPLTSFDTTSFLLHSN